MQSDFECIKIKDGLYLSNLSTAQDGQFLQINKFTHIVNCSAQSPNHFQKQGVLYLKYKLQRDKEHKLWEEDKMSKLTKLQRFVAAAEEQSVCCLIFSANGNNRSLVLLVALLMSKYRWALSKALEYVRAKSVFIGLSEHNIGQLELLQSILTKDQNKAPLTYGWKGPYLDTEEELIVKTFVNSQDIAISRDKKKIKHQRRVVWADRIEKKKKSMHEKNNQKHHQHCQHHQQKNTVEENFKETINNLELFQNNNLEENLKNREEGKNTKSQCKMGNKHIEEPFKRKKYFKKNNQNINIIENQIKNEEDKQKSNSNKMENNKRINMKTDKQIYKANQKINTIRNNSFTKTVKGAKLQKKNQQIEEQQKCTRENLKQKKEESEQQSDLTKQNVPMGASAMKFMNEKDLIKLIKKNLRANRQQINCKQDFAKNEKQVYKLTINNYIQPNINIVSTTNGNEEVKKINRANSEKQTREKGKVRSFHKKHTQSSPRRQKRIEKTVSLQFKKCP